MAKLTNKDRQKELDFIKWNLSQVQKKDLSGKMEYCNFCSMKTQAGCKATQEQRELESLCAKANNKKERK